MRVRTIKRSVLYVAMRSSTYAAGFVCACLRWFTCLCHGKDTGQAMVHLGVGMASAQFASQYISCSLSQNVCDLHIQVVRWMQAQLDTEHSHLTHTVPTMSLSCTLTVSLPTHVTLSSGSASSSAISKLRAPCVNESCHCAVAVAAGAARERVRIIHVYTCACACVCACAMWS
jgi:hypothetical protein